MLQGCQAGEPSFSSVALRPVGIGLRWGSCVLLAVGGNTGEMFSPPSWNSLLRGCQSSAGPLPAPALWHLSKAIRACLLTASSAVRGIRQAEPVNAAEAPARLPAGPGVQSAPGPPPRSCPQGQAGRSGALGSQHPGFAHCPSPCSLVGLSPHCNTPHHRQSPPLPPKEAVFGFERKRKNVLLSRHLTPLFPLFLHPIFTKVCSATCHSPECCFGAWRQGTVPSSCPQGADVVVGGTAMKPYGEAVCDDTVAQTLCWTLCGTRGELPSPALFAPLCGSFGERVPQRT